MEYYKEKEKQESSGHELIGNDVLICHSPVFEMNIQRAFKRCIGEAGFLTCLKSAKVISLHKKSLSYRPVTVLTTLWEVFEKIVL